MTVELLQQPGRMVGEQHNQDGKQAGYALASRHGTHPASHNHTITSQPVQTSSRPTHSRLPTPSLMWAGERAAQPHLMGAVVRGLAPAGNRAM